MKITYTCLNEDCAHEFEMEVGKIIPAKLYGPPENCYPEEGGEIEPMECPLCGYGIDEDFAYKLTEEADEAAREWAAEDRMED